jgi:hypothetical protein
MSRKREQQRENRRTLARQLGVHGKDVPTRLLDNERVTEPEVKLVSLVVHQAKRGFFEKAAPATLHVALFVIDAAGARCCRRATFSTTLHKGTATLVPVAVDDDFDDVVRYRRPGRFVVLTALVEGGGHDARLALGQRWVDDDGATVLVDGASAALHGDVVTRTTSPRMVELPASFGAGFLHAASALVAIDVVDRVRATLALPLSSADGSRTATLTLDVRL